MELTSGSCAVSQEKYTVYLRKSGKNAAGKMASEMISSSQCHKLPNLNKWHDDIVHSTREIHN